MSTISLRNQIKNFRRLITVLVLLIEMVGILPTDHAYALGSPIYVKSNALGANNGTSWADAYISLQSAISASVSGDEIWVAAGTYYPTTGTDRNATFTLKNGVSIYGGFAGTESLLAERDPVTNMTTLSGDVGSKAGYFDNSYHVVVSSGTDSTAVLDGFTIRGGYASNHPSDPYGGGVYNVNGSPTLSHLLITGNRATYGGGLFNFMGSSPTLTDVTFNGNSAERGGGIYNNNDADPILTDVTFSGNTALTYGGAMTVAGIDSTPTLTNVTFTGNTANFGGAISSVYGTISTLKNVTISGNTATTSGGGLYNFSNSNLNISNSIVYGNTGGEISNDGSSPVVTYSIVQGGYTGTGNQNVDPLLGALQNNGGDTQTMALSSNSPAIDAGDDGNCSAADQRGVSRPQGAHCDIGAYEVTTTLTVNKTDDTNDGICDSDCSMREAIAAASGNDIIDFDASLSGQTITLGSTLVLDKNLIIDGSTLSTPIRISGNNSVRIFQVIAGITVNMDSLVIMNGQSSSSGAGIYSEGSLTVLNSTFDGNLVSGHDANTNGGAIANYQGTLIVADTEFIDNTAEFDPDLTGGGLGGAIYSLSGALTVERSLFDGNTASRGGAIVCQGGTMTVNHSTYFSNSVFSTAGAGDGGAIYNSCDSYAEIASSTFSSNAATDHGGAILSDTDSNPLIVSNSTFYNNVAPSGGGIANYGGMVVINSTFSHNNSPSGGAIRNGLGGVLSLHNSILANSVGGVDCIKSDGAPEIENVNNLIETTGSNFESCGTAILTADPVLGSLQDNGGFTETIALLPSSPAINAGSDASCQDTDQRGLTRPQGAHCDMGAYELQAPTFTDVPHTYWAWSYIEGLYSAGVTSGCGVNPLRYCPTTTVTRDQMAVFLLKAKHGSSYLPPTPTGVFSDVPTNYWAAAWIEQLAAEGITSGCGINPLRYCPTTTVTRDQMAVFLLKAKHGSSYVPPIPSGVFNDVPTNYWAAAWIEQLATEGVTSGCGVNPLRYCPLTPVSRDQMAVFLDKAFGIPTIP